MQNMTDMSSEKAIAAAQYIEERDYWLEKLADPPAKSMFPYDYNITPREKTGKENDVLGFELPGDLYAKLIKIISGSDQRLHIVLAAAIVLLLSKYNSTTDIIVGAPSIRQKAKANFINTVLILRNQLPPPGSDESLNFKELLLQMRRTIQEATQHINYPIETLLYHLNIPYTPEDFPLFDIAILVRNIHDKEDIRHINCSMVFSFLRTGNSIEGEVEYNRLRYKKITIERIIAHFQHLLSQVLFNVDRPVSGIEIVLEEEKTQILHDFNNTAMDFSPKTFQRLFEEQAGQTPDNIALVGPLKIKNRSYMTYTTYISYRQLDKHANQLAHLLGKKGVTSDTIVGIVVDRSVEMIIGILGILKAGGAYLPIDPEYPAERNRFMLADSGVKILLAASEIQDKVKAEVQERFIDIIDISNLLFSSTFTSTSTCRVSPANLAYIIYTSGSTGKPKGVMVEHKGPGNLKLFHKRSYGVTGKDKIIQFSSGSFDASVWEITMALLNGAGLHMVDKGTIGDYEEFGVFLNRNQVSVVTLPPFYANQLNLDELRSLRLLITAGSPPTLALVDKCRKKEHMKYVNAYGPTEVTICATSWDIASIDKDISGCHSVPIGKPLSNTYIYILDVHLRLLPIGIVGEMYVSGIGLSRGYL
ncbi:MAG: AMP-binding protein, partial [Candidatus Aminicenantes bacterium]